MKISLHFPMNENQFSHERMSPRTHFEEEAKRNSEMAYYTDRPLCELQGNTSCMARISDEPLVAKPKYIWPVKSAGKERKLITFVQIH